MNNATGKSLLSLEAYVPKELREKPKTTVVFRKFDDGEIIAIFPEENYLHYESPYKQSYMHKGQHGLFNIGVFDQHTEEATALEFTDLARELRSIGYNLDIQQDYQYTN